MARPLKFGVKLSTKVPVRVLDDLKVQAAAMNGSLGDAVALLHAQAKAPEDHVARLLEAVKDAQRAEKGALDAARQAARRAEKAEIRLAKMSAVSKAKARHYQESNE